eukprot:g10327.t1
MGGFFPLTLAVLAAICGGIAAVNPCLVLDAGRCEVGKTSLNLSLCGIVDEDIEDLKACFEHVGQGNVRYLYLQSNLLTTIAPGTFEHFTALEVLNLWDNSLLTTIPSGTFDPLTALVKLELRFNALTTLPPGIFDSLEDLEVLDLRFNDLRTLPAGILYSLGVLRTVYLEGNPDLTCLPALPPSATYIKIDPSDFPGSCGCEFGDFADPCDEESLTCTPGSTGYVCAVGCDPDQGNVQCEDGQVCCDDREVCVDVDDVDLYNPTACGDPHMITYITGVSILTADAAGVGHSIVIEVTDPHNMYSSCPAGVSPCLADGSLSVFLDGVETLLAPGTVSLGPGVKISAANLPVPCRSIGFEKYWERKQRENARSTRRLSESTSMGEWILGGPSITNREECVEYVARAEAGGDGVFAHQSEHASFQIVTPKATVRLSHGRLHQIAVRNQTDQVDLPDDLSWQMNMAVDHPQVSRDAKGILGETFIPTRDGNGNPIMAGMEAIRGQQEDYRVDGSLGMDFAQDGHH